MTAEAVEERQLTRPSIIVDTQDLELGHHLALLVDKLSLEPTKVDVMLTRRPTPDDKVAGHLLVTGTPEQLNIFRHALGVYEESVQSGMTELGIRSTMNNFFSLQQLRHGQRLA